MLQEKGGDNMRLSDLWWLILLRGFFLILFGLAAIAWPGMTLATLALIFALYIIVAGVINIVTGVLSGEALRYWFLILLLGVIEIGVGVYTLRSPGVTLGALVLLIGGMFTVRGVLQVIAGFDEAYSDSYKRLHIIAGVLAIIAGIITLRYPASAGLIFTWVLGVYALVAGAIWIALSVTVRELVAEVRQTVRRTRA